MRRASYPSFCYFNAADENEHVIVLIFVNRAQMLLASHMVQSWLRKFEQGDKWSFCLTAGTLWPANQERP